MAKALIRTLNRKGTEKSHKPPVARKAAKPLPDPSCCERCGSLFHRQVWRRAGARPFALLETVNWTVCPACLMFERGEYFGRVVVSGEFARLHEQEIRARIDNVAERAMFTQPQRRVVSAERDGTVFEVLTTSQKLAHRIVQELKKTWRGTARYSWSPDDGCLYATWERKA